MELEIEADGTVCDVTEDEVVRLLADERDSGELFTLTPGESRFLQAGEAQWVVRTTDINGWEDSYFASLAGLPEREPPPPRYVIWHREPDDDRMSFATQILTRGELREVFRQ